MAKQYKHYPLWHPKLWVSWLVVFLFYMLSFLPMKTKQYLGEKLGIFFKKRFQSRYNVARKNIQACFPHLSASQQDNLIEANFVACTRGFFESIHAWWQNSSQYAEKVIITGRHHLEKAYEFDNGVLLLGGHFSVFDLIIPITADYLRNPAYMYRPNDNPVVDRMIEKGRRRHVKNRFTKRELKEMVEYLKSGGTVWYACDQDFGKRSELFVPFFGVPAGYITTPTWIANESNASVIFISHYRHPNGQYEIEFSPVLENFGVDAEQDAVAWNACLEKAICKQPENYLWLHKRFKTRPKGDAKFY